MYAKSDIVKKYSNHSIEFSFMILNRLKIYILYNVEQYKCVIGM